MRPRRKRFTLGSLFSRPASVAAMGLLALGATALLWFMFVQPGLPVLAFELGARPDTEPGRIVAIHVTRGYRGPSSFYATVSYRSGAAEVMTNRTPVFAKLRPGENVTVKLVGGRPVEIVSPDGNLLVDDALAWDLAIPGTALIGVVLIALGSHFRRDVGGWWPQIDGRYVDPVRFEPLINRGLAVAAGLVVAALAIGAWNGFTGASPAPIFAPLLAALAIGAALTGMPRAVLWLHGS